MTLAKEAFVEECELIRSDTLENDLDIQGQFATEETMRDEFGWSEILVILVLDVYQCTFLKVW